jgi:hypothetical protein
MFRGGDVALSFCASVGACSHERQAAGNPSSAIWTITAVFMIAHPCVRHLYVADTAGTGSAGASTAAPRAVDSTQAARVAGRMHKQRFIF